MKRAIIIALTLVFSTLLCTAQNVQQAADHQRQLEIQQQQQQRALQEQRRLEAEQQLERQRELDRRYQNAVESAQRKFEQRQYVQARQDYMTAREFKPAQAEFINQKIAEIDRIILDQERRHAEAEREARYQNAITSAERNFNERQFEQAEQDYRTALEAKPENAAYVNARISEVNRKKNEPALLHIYRKRSFGGLFEKYDILLDNAVVGRSSNNWKTTVTVNTFGTKTVSANIERRRAEVRINFEPGGVYYIRSDVKTTETYRSGNTRTTRTIPTLPTLQLMDSGVGASEFNAIVVR